MSDDLQPEISGDPLEVIIAVITAMYEEKRANKFHGRTEIMINWNGGFVPYASISDQKTLKFRRNGQNDDNSES
mgnify:CR=1 FL=1